MLKPLPKMIEMSTDSIIKFFDTCTYRPIILNDQEIVEWPVDMPEFIFASPTSLVDADYIKTVLLERKLLK